MSYVGGVGNAGLGSYFTYAGYGSAGCGCSGMGCSCSGYGAAAPVDFDPARVMSNIAKSDACYGPGGACAGSNAGTAGCQAASGACNYAGQQANKEIAVALNALGYGPIAVDGSISWQAAYSRFLADNGLTKGPGFGITNQALLTMKAQLDAGETPGPNTPTEYEKVGGEYIPKKPGLETPESLGGMGTAGWIVLAAVVGVAGYAVYKSRKKQKGAVGARPQVSSRAMTAAAR